MNVLFRVAVVGVVGVRMLRDVAVIAVVVIVIAVISVTVRLHATVVGMVGVRMLRVVIARVGMGVGHCKLSIGFVTGVRSRKLVVILIDNGVVKRVFARRLASGAVTVQVEQVAQWGEGGASRRLREVPIDQGLQLVVQVYVLDCAAGHAHEMVVVRQQRFGQLEVGTIAEDRDPVDHTRAFEHLEVAVGRADGKIGVGQGDLNQRDRSSGARKCLDQPPTPGGVAIVMSRQTHAHHGVEISKGGGQVRLACCLGHDSTQL